MLTYLAIIDNPALEGRLRRWFTSTFGCSTARCVKTVEEARAECSPGTNIQVIIADLLPGKTLADRHDDVAALGGGHAKIFILQADAPRVRAYSGKRAFTVMPTARFETALGAALRSSRVH